MVEEIIYTSAEKGLKQGSRGFCTVVSTSGMALNLAERLESMSGYRQAFPLNDPQSSLNPVNYSHVTMRLAGKKLHVLSRVADAGQDYTGRSNKLAHHLVIGSVVNLAAGPARLLADASVIVDRWDGVVRHIPPRELPTPSIPSTIQLSAWKAICGDGGWAGSVAEQLLQNPAPLSVIFGAGTDTLSLVREVLDLVPAAQRWNITFSTYFTRLLAGAECQLRFVLNDTPEATALRNDARARVVDLTKPLPAATGGTLIAIARSGQLTPQEPAPVAPTTRTAIQSKEHVAAASPKAAALPAPLWFGQPTIGDATEDLPDIPFPVSRSRRKLMLVVALLLFTTVTGTLVATVMFLGKGGKPDKFSKIVANTVPADSQQSIDDGKPAAEKARLAAEAAKAEEARVVAEAAKAEEVRVDAVAAKAEEVRVAAEKIRVEEAKKLADKKLSDDYWEKQGPFFFIRQDETRRDSHDQWLFELPKPGEDIEPESLPLSVKDQNVELALFEGAKHLFAGSPYKLELIQSPDDPNKWIAKANEIELAEYTIEWIDSASDAERTPNRLVHFHWLPASNREKEASELLRWWPLQIRVGDRNAVLLQRKAVNLSTQLSWKTLLASNDFTFPKSDELTAVTLDNKSPVSLTLQITEADHEPQELTIKIRAEEDTDADEPAAEEDTDADEPAAEGHHDPSADDPPGTTVRYFSLKLPLKFVEAPPGIDDSPLGFGTLKMSLNYAARKGLIFRPKMSITVRLPQKHLVNSFPSVAMGEELNSLAKNPRLLEKIPQNIFDEARKEMSIFVDAIKKDQSLWHTQKLVKLPGKKSFNATFKNRANAAIKSIRSVIPNLEKALTNAKRTLADYKPAIGEDVVNDPSPQLRTLRSNVVSAQDAFAKATPFAPAVKTFSSLMNELITHVDKEIEILLHDHQPISNLVQAFENADNEGQFQVQCQLSGQVETPGSDHRESLILYFIESMPEDKRR